MISQCMDTVLNSACITWGQYFKGARQESSSELGKMSLYGYRRNCLRAHDLCSRARSRPSKSFNYKKYDTTHYSQGT